MPNIEQDDLTDSSGSAEHGGTAITNNNNRTVIPINGNDIVMSPSPPSNVTRVNVMRNGSTTANGNAAEVR